MSVFSNGGNATLEQVIQHLRTLPPEMVVQAGFTFPHSYRGYYEDLAFEPAENVTVRSMLECAEAALGKTFSGYKGGDYRMTKSTDCWLANYGYTGVPIVLPGVSVVYELPSAPR